MASPIRQDDATGLSIKTTEISSEHYQNVILCGTAGDAIGVSANPAHVELTEGTAEIGNVKNSGTFAVQATLGAETTKVIGTVNISSGQTVTASGPLTDVQLRASAVPVSLATVPALVTGAAIIGAAKDAGANSYGTNTYTTSANMTTAADIGPAPTSGQYSVLHQATISTDTAMLFTFQMETTAGAERHAFRLPANGTVVFIPRYPIKLGTVNKKWQGLASAAGNVYVSVVTTSEA